VINSTNLNCLIPSIKDSRLAAAGSDSKSNSNSILNMAEYAVYIQFNDLDKLVINEDISELKLIKVYPDPIFKEAQIFNDKNRIILIEVSLYFIIIK
jgi:hypothetical protein